MFNCRKYKSLHEIILFVLHGFAGLFSFLVMCFSVQANAQNLGSELISNGDFASPNYSGGTQVFPTDWTTAGNTNGIHRSNNRSDSTGNDQYYPVGGWHGSPGGSIYQDVTLIIGEEYELTFHHGSRFGGDAIGNVTIEGSNGDLTLATLNVETSSGNNFETYRFIANNTVTRLRFTLVAHVTGNTDWDIDAVSLKQVFRAKLNAGKSVEVYDDGSQNLYALPGNDVIYTISINNEGYGPTDVDSLFLTDKLSEELTFFNGDIDGVGPETNPVSFTQSSGAGLTFTYSTDVAYSNSNSLPTSFSDCTYVPNGGYDANVTHICFNPKGAIIAGNPDPTFSVSFRARIK